MTMQETSEFLRRIGMILEKARQNVKTNLKLMRRFYQIYSNDSIGETVFTQFKNLPKTETVRRFYLSWSHYLKLMRITNVDERHFYEIESVRNDWSLAELRRQFGSALYERMALSRDKEKVALLSKDGQTIETPADAVKDPYYFYRMGQQFPFPASCHSIPQVGLEASLSLTGIFNPRAC